MDELSASLNAARIPGFLRETVSRVLVAEDGQ